MNSMVRNIIIAILTVCLLVVTHALVRVENQRYAMMVGMCETSTPLVGTGKCVVVHDYQCLAKVQTRTSWWSHLYYALAN